MTISTTPLSDSAEVEALPEASPPPACAAAQQFKVLVVDDSPIVRRIVGRRIEKLPGLSVIEAGDGEEALAIIDREAPALVLTDMQMPRMNGLELVAAVREKYSHIPVILMTAQDNENLAIRALRAGAANYVSKKTLNDELADILNRVLAVAAVRGRRQCVLGCLEVREVRFKLGCDPDLVGPLIEMLLDDLAFHGPLRFDRPHPGGCRASRGDRQRALSRQP